MAVVKTNSAGLSITKNGQEIQIVGSSSAVTATLPTTTDNLMGEASSIATQTDLETATSNVKYTSAGRAQFHPSASKMWCKMGVTGNILASFNVTSLTDTGTGVVAVTINVDFSSVDYAVVAGCEATATSYAVANARDVHIRSATLAAGTFSLDCIDKTATTNLVKDPTTWHVVCYGDR
jgi:hypothetical protein